MYTLALTAKLTPTNVEILPVLKKAIFAKDAVKEALANLESVLMRLMEPQVAGTTLVTDGKLSHILDSIDYPTAVIHQDTLIINLTYSDDSEFNNADVRQFIDMFNSFSSDCLCAWDQGSMYFKHWKFLYSEDTELLLIIPSTQGYTEEESGVEDASRNLSEYTLSDLDDNPINIPISYGVMGL